MEGGNGGFVEGGREEESPGRALNEWKRKGGKLLRSMTQYRSEVLNESRTRGFHCCGSMAEETKERKEETVSLAEEVEA